MDEQKNVVGLLLHHTAVTFTLAIILGMTVGTFMEANPAAEYTGAFIGSEGLAHSALAQLLALCFVMSVFITLLAEDVILTKVRLLWRMALLFASCLASSITFAVVFRWIPLDEWEAWLGLIVPFVTFFLLGIGAAALKTAWEDRRYGKLLSDYKSKQGGQHD